MKLKELIKQKKTKKENEKIKQKELENQKNTKKVNNVPCDHSPYVFIRPDTISHIVIKNKKECTKNCSEHPCTFLCPSHVYGWTEDGVHVDFQRCIECGACNIFCPLGNIQWNYPRSGFGVERKY